LSQLAEVPSSLMRQIALCLDFLTKADKEKYFERVPSDKDAPNYSKMIDKKMAIANMRKKAVEHGYKALDQLHGDVKQCVHNCVRYNVYDSPFTKCALKLLAKWLVFYSLLTQSLAPSCEQSSAAAAAVAAEAQAPKKRKGDADTISSSSSSIAVASIAPISKKPRVADDSVAVVAATAVVPAAVSSPPDVPIAFASEAGTAAGEEVMDVEMNLDEAQAITALHQASRGFYTLDQAHIQVPSILSSDELRRRLEPARAKGATQELLVALKLAWDYLIMLDRDKVFAHPVSAPLSACRVSIVAHVLPGADLRPDVSSDHRASYGP
jgi:hypothetical protein